MRIFVFVGLCGMVLVGRLGADNEHEIKSPTAKPLTLEMRRPYATAPAPLMALVGIAPHGENRMLRISADGEGFYRSSDVQLDGLAAPRMHQIWWDGLPPGRYCVEAILFRSTERTASVRRPYLVLGRGAKPVKTEVDTCDGAEHSQIFPPRVAADGTTD